MLPVGEGFKTELSGYRPVVTCYLSRPEAYQDLRFIFLQSILSTSMAVGPLANIDPRDVAAIDLERILQRLDHKVLSPDADSQLQHSSYERSKTIIVRRFLQLHCILLPHMVYIC